MKLSSSLPVVVRACFFPDANLTESVLLFVNCDCPSSLFPKRRNSPVVDVRVASISSAPLTNFRTRSKTRCPCCASEVCVHEYPILCIFYQLIVVTVSRFHAHVGHANDRELVGVCPHATVTPSLPNLGRCPA